MYIPKEVNPRICKDFTETLREADAELPAIAGARGFSSHLIHFDTLHVLYRGVGPDFVASTLVLVFGQKLLPEAHELARSWCRAQGASLSVDDFTFSYEGRFPSLNAKGWDVRLLLLWLVAWHSYSARFSVFVDYCLPLTSPNMYINIYGRGNYTPNYIIRSRLKWCRVALKDGQMVSTQRLLT